MNYEILNLKSENGIGIITISRPEAMNALNSRFFNEMNSMISEISVNDSIKVVIITGEGKAFVAGADIAEMVDKTQKDGEIFSKIGQKCFRDIELLNKPVIAAVNGFALGGGCELAMACDIRIASEKAKFGQPEVSLGLIPGFSGTQRLSRISGMGNALLLLLTGDMIRADEALRIGLVQKIVAPEELMNETIKIAKAIASKGPKAVQLVKEVTRKGYEKDFEDGNRLEAMNFGTLFENEGTEGMKAFLEKREPNW